jgi:pimeloyl-ACP methyl ester carboxylesterase
MPLSESKPRYLLVHGAWHSGACWNMVATQLRAQGCTVDCPDLPGHGNSALPLDRVSLKRYVEAVLALIDSCEEDIVLVGHSMAGMVVTEAACARSARIRALVYLCAYLPRPDESIFDLIALNRSHEPFSAIELAMELSSDKRRCTVDPGQVIGLFYGAVPPDKAQHLLQEFGPQASLPLSTRVRFDQSVFAGLATHYLCCSKDQVIPLHHQRRMLQRQPCRNLLQIDSDHSPFHSCPDVLAGLLLALPHA